jgi:hypothetical protein
VSWLGDHQVLVAGLVLVALVVIGLVALIVRAVGLYRTSQSQMRRVQEPMATISAGLTDAERRVGAITSESEDLSTALDRVAAHAGELRVLVDHAGRALSTLRAPFRYLGR